MYTVHARLDNVLPTLAFTCHLSPSGNAAFLHGAALCGDHEGTLLHQGTYVHVRTCTL